LCSKELYLKHLTPPNPKDTPRGCWIFLFLLKLIFLFLFAVARIVGWTKKIMGLVCLIKALAGLTKMAIWLVKFAQNTPWLTYHGTSFCSSNKNSKKKALKITLNSLFLAPSVIYYLLFITLIFHRHRIVSLSSPIQ
jgi:glucan phosphoethanolaminetransferase (alkaline phosphatase superfamily)